MLYSNKIFTFKGGQMGKSRSVGIGVKIRVFILFLLGAVFVLPSLALIVTGFMEPNPYSDDALGMFFMGAMLGICGFTIWWVMRKMYRRAKHDVKIYSDTDYMAMGMAQAHFMAGMHDGDGDGGDSGDDGGADFDSGDSGDSGGFDGDFSD